MATLYISYFDSVRYGVAEGPIKSEAVSTSTSSAAGGAIPANAKVAFLFSDTAHYVTLREGTPTAAITNSFYLPANVGREIAVLPTTSKIAAITLA